MRETSNMDYSRLFAVIKKYFITVLGVAVICGGVFVYLLDWYKLNNTESKSINAERVELEKLRADFEKYKFDQENLLRQKEIDLEKHKLSIENDQKTVEAQKNSVSQKDVQNEFERSKIRQDAVKVGEEFDRVNAETINLGEKARIQKEEDYIRELMRQYNDLGVDLNTSVRCKSEDYVQKYNKAKSLLDEISNRAENIGKYDKYRSFILSQSRMTTSLTFGREDSGC